VLLTLALACTELPARGLPTGSRDDSTAGIDTADTASAAPCPDGVICVESLPYTHSADTSDGAYGFDSYGCSSTTDESGPELVYRVTTEERGWLGLAGAAHPLKGGPSMGPPTRAHAPADPPPGRASRPLR